MARHNIAPKWMFWTLPVFMIATATVASDGTSKPNIVIIIVDDLGYADIGFHDGGLPVPTPNINQLVAAGVRFSNGYVTAPVCSPSRAGLITGRYQQRFGYEFNTGGAKAYGADKVGLPAGELTLAEIVKNAGYATGIVGKWHLGSRDDQHPLNRGFDEFFGFLGGVHGYFPSQTKRNSMLHGFEPVMVNDYLTDVFSRKAVSFINRHASQPFFLYLSYNAVHTPMEAAQRHRGAFPEVEPRRRQTLAEMVAAMDEGIGLVVEKLEAEGLADNTVVFFIDDNGGSSGNASVNTPLSGFKGQVWEGGIRVPFAMRWPNRLPAGMTYDQPVISLDIFATALAAAGTSMPDGRVIDGVNLIPYLTGQTDESPHPCLFWRYGYQRAVRQGDWKLMRALDGGERLHNLSKDVAETQNLLEENPGIAARLRQAWQDWNDQLVKPLWLPNRRLEKDQKAIESE